MTGKRLKVCVAYAEAGRQALLRLAVPQGATLLEAAQQSGLAQRFPNLDLAAAAKGIHGRRLPNDHPVQDGDRIEIYRPLHQTPKEARRRRAGKGRA